MDLTGIGSVGSYLKRMGLQAQWNLKKDSGNVTGHGKTLEEWLDGEKKAASSAASPPEADQGDSQLKDIHAKLYSGKSLSADEQSYLQLHDPIAYNKFQSIQQEKKSYEQALKRCRTKEDVQRLRMQHLGMSLSAVDSIKNNPNISDAKKLEYIAQENAKTNALETVLRKFTRRGLYHKLPTEAERAKASADAKEVQQPERPDPGKPSKPDAPEQSPAPAGGKEPPPEAQTAKPIDEKAAPEESLEMKKVRRAKAVATYGQLADEPELPSFFNGAAAHTIDKQA